MAIPENNVKNAALQNVNYCVIFWPCYIKNGGKMSVAEKKKSDKMELYSVKKWR